MAGIETLTEPGKEPIGIKDTKEHLRLGEQEGDALVKSFIMVAREYAEAYTGKVFINRTLKLSMDNFYAVEGPLWEGKREGAYMPFYRNYFELPVGPTVSVSKIAHYSDSDRETIWDPSTYYLDKSMTPARVVIRENFSYPGNLRRANAIEITYVAGFGVEPTDVPESLRVAMRQYVAYLYDHRGDDMGRDMQVPTIIHSLLNKHRTIRLTGAPYGSTGGVKTI